MVSAGADGVAAAPSVWELAVEVSVGCRGSAAIDALTASAMSKIENTASRK